MLSCSQPPIHGELSVSLLTLRDMNGTIMFENMREGYASQFKSPCVVISGPFQASSDVTDIVKFARAIGAECTLECEPGEQPDLVIDFAYSTIGRQVGPEVYTEDALLATVNEALQPV